MALPLLKPYLTKAFDRIDIFVQLQQLLLQGIVSGNVIASKPTKRARRAPEVAKLANRPCTEGIYRLFGLSYSGWWPKLGWLISCHPFPALPRRPIVFRILCCRMSRTMVESTKSSITESSSWALLWIRALSLITRLEKDPKRSENRAPINKVT